MSETQSKDGKKSLSPQSSTSQTNLNIFSLQSNNPLCLKQSTDLLKLSYPCKSKQLDDQHTQHIRITYSKTKNNKKQIQKSQAKELKVVCIQHDQFQIKQKLLVSISNKFSIKGWKEKFYNWKIRKETIQLNGQLQYIKAEICFNDVQIPDHVLGLIHLEVDYEFLEKDKTWVEHCQNIESILTKRSIKQTMSQNVIEEISNNLYTKKRKPTIADISKKLFHDSQIFRVGKALS